MNQKRIAANILNQSRDLINSKEFLDAHRIGNAFTRSGKLSFSALIYYTLQATHKSISINYAQLRETFGSGRLPFVSKQAISKARQGISHKAFEELFRISVEIYYRNFKKYPLWNGFHIYAVDGSTIQIPQSQENLEVFGGNPNKTHKLSPLASVSVLYDVMNDMLVDVTLNPYRCNERTSAKEHMEFIPHSSNCLVLFDRGYPCEELFRYLDSKGVFFLMRLPKTFKKLIFQQNDALFTYPASTSEKELTLRSVNFLLKKGTKEYLVTNIMPERLKVSEFPHLYQMRWGVESKYRELKNRFEIENWGSIKPIALKQEFFAAMFISNLTAVLKMAADSKLPENTDNKHSYQTNRSYILNRIKSNIVFLVTAADYSCIKFCVNGYVKMQVYGV